MTLRVEDVEGTALADTPLGEIRAACESISKSNITAFKERLRKINAQAIQRTIPVEARAAMEIAEAHREGDEELVWRLVQEFVGAPPDDVLCSACWPELKVGGETFSMLDWQRGLVPVILWFLRYHRARMGAVPHEWYGERGRWVYRRLNKNPRWELMRVLRKYPGSPYKRLRSETSKATREAEAAGYFGVERYPKILLRGVDSAIVRAHRGIDDVGRRTENEHGAEVMKTVPLDWEIEDTYADGLEAETFARLEKERRRDSLSDEFTPVELRIVEFLRYEYVHKEHGPTPQQAVAQELGIAISTVGVHVHNISNKHSA